MSKTVFVVFPHQLFKDIKPLEQADEVHLVEEYLYFNQYAFHKQKLALHRASMQYYRHYLDQCGLAVRYTEAIQPACDVRKLIAQLAEEGATRLCFYDVCDNWLEKRILQSCQSFGITCQELPTPLFLNTKNDLEAYFGSRKKYFQTDFYIQQRKKRNILLDEQGKPVGEKWSHDTENREKYPKDKQPPWVYFPALNSFMTEAIAYVEQHYGQNHGQISTTFIYPSTHAESEVWLQQFLETRFQEFGVYEDAMVDGSAVLHHSVLSPLLNIGLLLPGQVVDAALAYAKVNQVPLNSQEGFIRQIIGWREFIRGVYVYSGVRERTTNFWKFSRQLPAAFYTAKTGIPPLDGVIRQVLKTAYCHHIERLMILGNYMLLTETDPDAVYQWFMELFIDAYDWVMVPNVYGMSQFADGGLMATKPYISGSSYILKMSNYRKGDWTAVWDALFWRFMNRHRAFFLSNPRLGMLIKTYDKMIEARKADIESKAGKAMLPMSDLPH
ncbi:MAG: cryptochrome/photolyase family protein [Chitinophagales bacterium]|nr:cryptochrome/photolyase family protein [Chitinophagales bacterium]